MQYAKWIGDIVLRGTLGHSPYSGSSAGATVEEKLAGRAGVTVELGLRAILSGLIIAAPIGIYSAIRQSTCISTIRRCSAPWIRNSGNCNGCPSPTATPSWIRGDMLKRGKQERFLAEIVGSVIRRYGSQVTWHSLAADLSIDHPMTVADYVQLLAQMDVLIVQHALREDRLAAAPKKARKVVLSDPFIFHALRSWLDAVDDPFAAQVKPAVDNREWAGKLAEACAAAHHHRMHPTYYIKGDARSISPSSPARRSGRSK